MNYATQLARQYSANARRKRAQIFKSLFSLTPDTKILDLGSEDGTHIHSLLKDTEVRPQNVYIADIKQDLIDKGHRQYEYNPVFIDESKPLPFEDHYFDIVYCSSVIEHVTFPKEEVWKVRCGKTFRNTSLQRQKQFAQEIERVSKQYYVQTPYRYFFLESHSWLPFVAWLPRWALLPFLRTINRFWIKKTNPDWHLLDSREMSSLFSGASIVKERSMGMTKSLMAVYTE